MQSNRHYFRFPDHIREAVRAHVAKAVNGVRTAQFRQEPQYATAVAARLMGTAYDEKDGKIVFDATAVNDRGPGAAEHETGVDLVIIGTISDGDQTIEKAILIQAKRGTVSKLPKGERERLIGQIKDMAKRTRAPKVMEIEEAGELRIPRIVSGRAIMSGSSSYKRPSLEDFLAGRFMTTLDGDTRPRFVEGVKDSALPTLLMLASMR